MDGIAEQGKSLLSRIDAMEEKVSDSKLVDARKKADAAAHLDVRDDCDLEDVQKASNDLLDAKKLIDQARQQNLKIIRQMDLDNCVEFFDEVVRPYASAAEIQVFENLSRTAQRSIDRNDSDFENILESMKDKNTVILIRQDWFVIDWYRRITASSANYIDKKRFAELKQMGDKALADDDMVQLRSIMGMLFDIRISLDSDGNMFDIANIVKG